jgi:hypothetical protein
MAGEMRLRVATLEAKKRTVSKASPNKKPNVTPSKDEGVVSTKRRHDGKTEPTQQEMKRDQTEERAPVDGPMQGKQTELERKEMEREQLKDAMRAELRATRKVVRSPYLY